MPDLIELLTDVRRLIAQGWCQYAQARRADGTACSPSDEQAVQWCLDGAVCRVVADPVRRADVLERLTEQACGRRPFGQRSAQVWPWNDQSSCSQEAALLLIDHTIGQLNRESSK